MSKGAKLEKSWRQLAAEVAQETDPKRLSKLTDELLRIMEEQKRQEDARPQVATKAPEKLRSA